MSTFTYNSVSVLEADLNLGDIDYDQLEPVLAAEESELEPEYDEVYQINDDNDPDDQLPSTTTAVSFFGPTIKETPITEADKALVTDKMIRQGQVAHPVLSKVLALEVADRSTLEDELRSWLKVTYPRIAEKAKSVAAATISRLRQMIDEGCSCLVLEGGYLRKPIPGTTSFADALLEQFTVSDGDRPIYGDEMLLAIGLDKNPQLCDAFHQLSSSIEDTPFLDPLAVRSASKTLGSQTYTGVYVLDFGGKKLYVGVSDDMVYRLKTHNEDEINVIVGKEKRELNAAGQTLHMRVVLGWPRGKLPKLASLAWETYLICALRTYKGENQMQIHTVGGLLGPGIAIKHFRPAYLRYVQATRDAAATHDLPPTRCFKLLNPYRHEFESSLKFYTNLFKDLIEDSKIDPVRFIQLVVGVYQGERNRNLVTEMQKQGYFPSFLAHPQGRKLAFGKKYNWEPELKGMHARALTLNQERGVAKPARTLRATTLPPLPEEYLQQMIAKYREKAELLKLIYPPDKSRDDAGMD